MGRPIYYKRFLPHYQQAGYPVFITFRLSGSIPHTLICSLKTEKEAELKRIQSVKNSKKQRELNSFLKREQFNNYEEALHHAASGPTWLKVPAVAGAVQSVLHSYDPSLYKLITYTIMPNHVHIVIIPEYSSAMEPVSSIMQKIKGKSSRECNLILNRSGTFWAPESYDHLVQSHEGLLKVVRYIMNNPVKAGLVSLPEQWPWSYYNPELLI